MAQSKITFEQYIGFEKQRLAGLNKKKKVNWGKILSFIFLTLFCVVWIFPFVILLAGSLRGYTDTLFYPKELFYPHSGYTLDNFMVLLTNKLPEGMAGQNTTKPFELGYWIFNTCISAIGGTLLYLLVASFAAYAFTFIDFKFRNLLFAILVATMVIPGTATTVGNQNFIFSTGMNKLTYPFQMLALIIPGLGGVYGMYLIKTFFTSITNDLIESAKMDGYNNFQIFFKIVLPLGKTVIFVQGLFGFMGGWNDLIWPQMLFGAGDSKNWTLQVGMAYIIHNYSNGKMIGVALASGVFCILPVFIVYLFAQNTIIEGMAGAGIKG